MTIYDYGNKLDKLCSITKNYKVTDIFCLLQDSEGWSDGFIANLTNVDTEIMTAKAKLYKTNHEIFKLTTDKSLCPKIKPVIKEGGEEVNDIEFDLNDLTVTLKSETITTKCNPMYIKYFKQLPLIKMTKLVITNELEPIKVYSESSLMGLIMPMHTN